MRRSFEARNALEFSTKEQWSNARNDMELGKNGEEVPRVMFMDLVETMLSIDTEVIDTQTRSGLRGLGGCCAEWFRSRQ